MAFTETTYTALTGPQGMYRFMVDMVAQGWTVAISSDGTTYNGSGNQISGDGSGAGGLDNEHAYYVLRRTGAPDWLVQRASTADIWRIRYSPSGVYAGGNATTRPTAGDEASAWDEFSTLFLSGTYDVEIHVEDAAPYRWALRTDDAIYVASVGSATRPIALFNAFATGGTFFSPTFTDQGAWEDVEAMLAATAGGGGGPSDTTDPVISAFTPASGSSIARADSVAVDVTDETSLGPVTISAEFADGTVLTVYQGGAFVGPFAAGSSQSGDTWTIEHDAPGWPSSTVDIYVLAVDGAGNTATATASFTVSDPPAAPSFGSFSPAAGSVARADNVDFTVTSADGFSEIVVWAVLAGGTTVMVYDGSAFGPEVNGASSVSGTTTRSFSITHDGDGWEDDYTLHVLAVDSRGVSASTSSAYTLSDPPAPPDPPDVTPPVVTVVSPAPPGPVGRNDAVRLRVTDSISLKRAWLFVTMNGEQYVVHNGYSFRPAYATGSTRTPIEGGYEFVVLRTGGWLAAPSFEVQAMDEAGNER